jgi:hypothetical protein
MAYVQGPLDPEYGIPVRDLEVIRRHVAEVRLNVPPLPPAVAERVSRILYGTQENLCTGRTPGSRKAPEAGQRS